MIKIVKPLDKETICLISKEAKSFYDDYKKQQKLIKNDYQLNGLDFGIDDQIKADCYFNKFESTYIARPVSF